MPHWSHSFGTRSRGSANTHSCDFDRANTQWWEIPAADCAALKMTGDRSVQFWMKYDLALPLGTRGIMGFWTSSVWYLTRLNWVLCMIISGGKTYFRALLHGGGASVNYQTQQWVLPDLGVTLNDWTHYCWTWDASEAQATQHNLCIDGADKGHGAIARAYAMSSSLPSTTAPFNLGCYSQQSYGVQLDGKLDDVRVYGKVLTPAENAADYDRELTVAEAATTITYWKLSDTSDEGPNSYTLIAADEGTPTFVTDPAF